MPTLEYTETRQIIRCRKCGLNQFWTTSGKCRRCSEELTAITETDLALRFIFTNSSMFDDPIVASTRGARYVKKKALTKHFLKYQRSNPSSLLGKLDYYGWKCRYCKIRLEEGVNLSWDHAIPQSRGGTDILCNLLPCCRSCNSSKNDLNIFEYLRLIKGQVRRKYYSRKMHLYAM